MPYVDNKLGEIGIEEQANVREPEIKQLLGSQAMLVGELGEMIEKMRNRLSPVLRNVPSQGAGEAKAKIAVERTGLGEALAQSNDFISGAVDALRDMLRRCEL